MLYKAGGNECDVTRCATDIKGIGAVVCVSDNNMRTQHQHLGGLTTYVHKNYKHMHKKLQPACTKRMVNMMYPTQHQERSSSCHGTPQKKNCTCVLHYTYDFHHHMRSPTAPNQPHNPPPSASTPPERSAHYGRWRVHRRLQLTLLQRWLLTLCQYPHNLLFSLQIRV